MRRGNELFQAARLSPTPETGVGLRAGLGAAARGFLVIVIYLALEWLSYLHAYKGIPVTPWNPGLGLVFGLAVLGGPLYAIILGIAVFLADALVLNVRLGAELIAIIALLAAAGYAFAAGLLRRRAVIDLALPRLHDVGLFLSVAIGAALCVDIITAGILITDDTIVKNDFFATFLPLFVGDAIGIAVFAPIVLRLAARLRATGRLAALWPQWGMIAIAGVIVFAIMALQAIFGTHGLRYLFILFVPIVFAGLRDGLDGACFSLAAAQLGLVAMLHATGQDLPTFIDVQAQMLVLTIAGLIVGAIVSERQTIAAAADMVAARLRALELEAAQAARVSLAEGMASALAHEINQPITAVRALARSAQHLLGSAHTDVERARRNVAEVIVQVDHAGQIIRRMREFLRRGHPHISTLDVEKLLHNAVALIETTASEQHVRIILQVEGGLATMYGDRTQIEQVLLNLMRNGLDAMAEAGTPSGRIDVGATRGSTPETVEFFVRDNGPGIPPDQTGRLFEPQVSAKPHGLGLGLAICTSIVHHHRGRLWLASSRPGHTEFRFSLPVDAGNA